MPTIVQDPFPPDAWEPHPFLEDETRSGCAACGHDLLSPCHVYALAGATVCA